MRLALGEPSSVLRAGFLPISSLMPLQEVAWKI